MLLGLVPSWLFGQKIQISGFVLDGNSGGTIPTALVVNKTTGTGNFSDAGGNFTVFGDKKDTILISSFGFQATKICFADSDGTEFQNRRIVLFRFSVNLGEATVFVRRPISVMEKERKNLKPFNENDFKLHGAAAFQSPITYLYQSWSRKEQSKRKVEEFRYRDRKNQLLKELFLHYAATGAIPIKVDEIDSFIEFSRVPDDYLQTAGQYELVIYFQEKYKTFKAIQNDK